MLERKKSAIVRLGKALHKQRRHQEALDSANGKVVNAYHDLMYLGYTHDEVKALAGKLKRMPNRKDAFWEAAQ